MASSTKGRNLLNKQRNRHKNVVTLFLLLIIYGFMFAFLPKDLIVSYINEFFSDDWIVTSAKLTTSALLSMMIRIPLFGVDRLATGESEYSVYFKSLYPSQFIKEKYGVEQGEADALWFEVFNEWAKKSHRNHQHWETDLERTHVCRLIFYTTKLLVVAAWVSGGILLVKAFLGLFTRQDVTANPVEFGYFLIVVIASILIRSMNRLPSKVRKEPTGCWFKYKEISEMINSIVKLEVLDRAHTYDDAMRIAREDKV